MSAKAIQNKVSFALDENRMLMLGSQVLLGFGYEVFFEAGYEKLPGYNQELQIANLILTLTAAVMLIAPTTYHRIVGADFDTERLIGITTALVELALFPMALSLGVSLFCCSATVVSFTQALIVGVIFAMTSLLAWSACPYLGRHQDWFSPPKMKYTTPLDTRLRHVLTEARVMLPGAQAILGFQLITFYTETFMKMPSSWKYIHLGSVVLIATVVVMLIAPAAFHRIADKGEATERSYAFASRMVILAAIPLGLGLSGELTLVMAKALHSLLLGVSSGASVLFLTYMLWFGIAYHAKTTPRENQH